MTEIYEECQEMLEVIRKRRPAWLQEPPDLASFHRLRADWTGGRGFWYRARHDTADEAMRIAFLEGNRLQLARAEARERRKDMKSLRFDSIQLTGWTGRPLAPVPGWDGSSVDAWRLEFFESWWRHLIVRPQQPYLDWLGPFVYLGALAKERPSWNHLWLHEVDVGEMTRQRLRWAVGFLQGVRKVTSGTPADNQLSVYCYEANAFVSADNTLVEIINRARLDAGPTRRGTCRAV